MSSPQSPPVLSVCSLDAYVPAAAIAERERDANESCPPLPSPLNLFLIFLCFFLALSL